MFLFVSGLATGASWLCYFRALKLGGRGQWRVETSELEAFIERMYAETQQQLQHQGTTAPDSSSADETSGNAADQLSGEAPSQR